MDSYTSALQEKTTEAINAEASNVARDLSSGSAASFDDYKEKSGYIRGLMKAIEIMNDTEKKVAKGED